MCKTCNYFIQEFYEQIKKKILHQNDKILILSFLYQTQYIEEKKILSNDRKRSVRGHFVK